MGRGEGRSGSNGKGKGKWAMEKECKEKRGSIRGESKRVDDGEIVRERGRTMKE